MGWGVARVVPPIEGVWGVARVVPPIEGSEGVGWWHGD